jgi:hypothetical protein
MTIKIKGMDVRNGFYLNCHLASYCGYVPLLSTLETFVLIEPILMWIWYLVISVIIHIELLILKPVEIGKVMAIHRFSCTRQLDPAY